VVWDPVGLSLGVDSYCAEVARKGAVDELGTGADFVVICLNERRVPTVAVEPKPETIAPMTTPSGSPPPGR